MEGLWWGVNACGKQENESLPDFQGNENHVTERLQSEHIRVPFPSPGGADRTWQ